MTLLHATPLLIVLAAAAVQVFLLRPVREVDADTVAIMAGRGLTGGISVAVQGLSVAPPARRVGREPVLPG